MRHTHTFDPMDETGTRACVLCGIRADRDFNLLHTHTWATSARGQRCLDCGEERVDHVHQWYPVLGHLRCACGLTHDEYLYPRRPVHGDRKPIVIISAIGRTSDAMREFRESMEHSVDWPLIILDSSWRVVE